MNETLPDTFLTAIGVKLTTLIAGFAGGIVSLAFLQGLSRRQALLAVIVGCLTAVYLTPVIVWWLNLSPNMENGTAFLLGLSAMNLIPLIKLGIATRAKRIADSVDPIKQDPP
jgi:hypothetical protein